MSAFYFQRWKCLTKNQRDVGAYVCISKNNFLFRLRTLKKYGQYSRLFIQCRYFFQADPTFLFCLQKIISYSIKSYQSHSQTSIFLAFPHITPCSSHSVQQLTKNSVAKCLLAMLRCDCFEFSNIICQSHECRTNHKKIFPFDWR